MSHRSIAVVGGGITGLVAARALALTGAEVTVIEATSRLGGQVRTVEFMGHQVDVGAEALHVAGPHVTELIDGVGLSDEVVESNPGSAWICTRNGLRRLPAGVGPAGPTRLGPVIRSRILSPIGMARAALEPLVPTGDRSSDVGVGTFLARRFGHQVTARLVDPVLGSLHAGDVSRLSLQAATPYVAAQVKDHRSLLLAHRARRSGATPSFISFPRGLGTLAGALAATAPITVRLDTTVTAIEPDTGGYQLSFGEGDTIGFDCVVLATPAHVASRVIRPLCETAAAGLAELNTASVATVLVAYPRAAADATPALGATGLLFPSKTAGLLKAATFLSSKWPQLDDPDHFLVRLSAGRSGSDEIAGLDDEALVARLHADLCAATGLATEPTGVHVERWPNALAQLEVGHLERLRKIRAELAGHPGTVLAGAPYEGIGIAACIRSGQLAATQLTSLLASPTGTAP